MRLRNPTNRKAPTIHSVTVGKKYTKAINANSSISLYTTNKVK